MSTELNCDFIDTSITGSDRRLLELFYTASLSEGGTSDEVTLRGLKAVLQQDLCRTHVLQQNNKLFREPERTILCDILANGTLLPDPKGIRYGLKMPQLKEEELLSLIPQSLKDDLSAVSNLANEATGGVVGAGIFRNSLNVGLLEFYKVLLDRGFVSTPTVEPPTDDQLEPSDIGGLRPSAYDAGNGWEISYERPREGGWWTTRDDKDRVVGVSHRTPEAAYAAVLKHNETRSYFAPIRPTLGGETQKSSPTKEELLEFIDLLLVSWVKHRSLSSSLSFEVDTARALVNHFSPIAPAQSELPGVRELVGRLQQVIINYIKNDSDPSEEAHTLLSVLKTYSTLSVNLPEQISLPLPSLTEVKQLPPRPPLSEPLNHPELVRYGMDWNGSPDSPLLVPKDDGYWTPWHIAASLITPLSDSPHKMKP